MHIEIPWRQRTGTNVWCASTLPTVHKNATECFGASALLDAPEKFKWRCHNFELIAAITNLAVSFMSKLRTASNSIFFNDNNFVYRNLLITVVLMSGDIWKRINIHRKNVKKGKTYLSFWRYKSASVSSKFKNNLGTPLFKASPFRLHHKLLKKISDYTNFKRRLRLPNMYFSVSPQYTCSYVLSMKRNVNVRPLTSCFQPRTFHILLQFMYWVLFV